MLLRRRTLRGAVGVRGRGGTGGDLGTRGGTADRNFVEDFLAIAGEEVMMYPIITYLESTFICLEISTARNMHASLPMSRPLNLTLFVCLLPR